MQTSDPTPSRTYGGAERGSAERGSAERGALLAARNAAAQHVYDAECALHTALQAARGASSREEAGQCDRWIAAAYAHLHTANLEYVAATAALDRPTPFHQDGTARAAA